MYNSLKVNESLVKAKFHRLLLLSGVAKTLFDTGQAVRVRGMYVTCRHPVCAGSFRQSAV